MVAPQPRPELPISLARDNFFITGESAPVIRESGESYIDKLIAMVEGANRQKTPNEIALGILLIALTAWMLWDSILSRVRSFRRTPRSLRWNLGN